MGGARGEGGGGRARGAGGICGGAQQGWGGQRSPPTRATRTPLANHLTCEQVSGHDAHCPHITGGEPLCSAHLWRQEPVCGVGVGGGRARVCVCVCGAAAARGAGQAEGRTRCHARLPPTPPRAAHQGVPSGFSPVTGRRSGWKKAASPKSMALTGVPGSSPSSRNCSERGVCVWCVRACVRGREGARRVLCGSSNPPPPLRGARAHPPPRGGSARCRA